MNPHWIAWLARIDAQIAAINLDIATARTRARLHRRRPKPYRKDQARDGQENR